MELEELKLKYKTLDQLLRAVKLLSCVLRLPKEKRNSLIHFYFNYNIYIPNPDLKLDSKVIDDEFLLMIRNYFKLKLDSLSKELNVNINL